MESADKDTQDVRKSNEQPTQIHYIQKKTAPSNTYSSSATKCYRYCGSHLATEVRFINLMYHFCTSEVTVKVCRMKSRDNSGIRGSEMKPKQTNWIKQDEIKHEDDPAYITLNVGSNPQKNPALVEVVVNKAPLQMQVDTGASVSIISYSTCVALWENPLQMSNQVKDLHALKKK